MDGSGMGRIARMVVQGCMHHVTQLGVRTMSIFRDDEDRRLYLRLLAERGETNRMRFLAWCLPALPCCSLTATEPRAKVRWGCITIGRYYLKISALLSISVSQTRACLDKTDPPLRADLAL